MTVEGGHTKEVWFDSKSRTRRVDINGRTVQRIDIDKDGRDVTVFDEDGNATRELYDSKFRKTKTILPDGTSQVRVINASGYLSETVNESGITTVYERDGSGRVLVKKEAVGEPEERVTAYEYTAGLVSKITRKAKPGQTDQVMLFTHDEFGNTASVTDGEGATTTFTHDVMGNVLTRTLPDNRIYTYTYDDTGNLKTVTTPDNRVYTYTYDDAGRVKTVTDPANNVVTYDYDTDGRLISVTDPTGATSDYAYDVHGNPNLQTDAEGKKSRQEFDTEGRLKKSIDGAGNTVELFYGANGSGCSSCDGGNSSKPYQIRYPTFIRKFAYNKRGWKVSDTDEDLSGKLLASQAYEYDALGHMIKMTDKNGLITEYEYDTLGRLVMVVDPKGQSTIYTYDAWDNLLALTDAKGQTTNFAYNRNGQLIKETRPMGEATHYAYDAIGRLASKTDAKNQKTTYGYDTADRLTDIKYFASATETTPVKTVSFTYNTLGQLTGYDDGTTTGTYAYDNAGRKISETVNYGPFSKSYAYDYADNGLKKQFTDPSGRVYEYDYDAANRLSAIRMPGNKAITYGDYQWARPKTVNLPGGSTREFTYDALMRVTKILAKDPAGSTVQNLDYTYDAMDNITKKSTTQGDFDYTYDDLYRLTDVKKYGTSDEAFTYDEVGNRITDKATGDTDWTYNQNNELIGSGNSAFEYDANGNTIKKTVGTDIQKYVFNIEDRMEQVQDGQGGSIASYYYDPFGRRLWKEVSGEKTYYHYTDEGLNGEYDASGNAIVTYGFTPNSTWTTDPVFMQRGDNTYFYHNDHLGTPQKLTDITGAVVWNGEYNAFGSVAIETETVSNNLRFAGQYWDSETKYNYNFFRYYNTNLGRYMSEDPIRLAGGINLFAYAADNPLINFDPDGLKCRNCYQELEACRNRVNKRNKMYLEEEEKGYQRVKKILDIAEKWAYKQCEWYKNFNHHAYVSCREGVRALYGLEQGVLYTAHVAIIAEIYAIFIIEMGNCENSYSICKRMNKRKCCNKK